MGSFSKNYHSAAEAIITRCAFMTVNQHKRVETELAVWDTGSTATIISSRLARQLNPEVFGKGGMSGIAGNAEGNTYLLHVSLPTGDVVTYVEVFEGDLEDYDAIIGMDIITMGNLHIDSIGGETVFSFVLP